MSKRGPVVRIEVQGQRIHRGFASGRRAAAPSRLQDQKIRSAFFSVIHTPQASGMPTKAQNTAALASKPPRPMPNEPDGVANAVRALAACSLATSSWLMYHLGSTGL